MVLFWSILGKDWTFHVHLEHRNRQLYEADGRKVKRWGQSGKSYMRTLPKGSVLQVDRIYVRKGADDYSSVTMLIVDTTDAVLTGEKKKTQPFSSNGTKFYARFWVKLIEFNDAEFEVVYDATRPLEMKQIPGDPITLGRFKNRKNAIWWVEFEHENPDFCFAGEISERLYETVFSYNQRSDLRSVGWTEKSRTTVGYNNTMQTNYWYTPPHYIRSFVPNSWREQHNGDARYTIKTKDWLGHDCDVTMHPLNDKIHIPYHKKDRKDLNLPDDKSLLERVPVAGGFLTVREIKEVAV